jgi:hypothetical protein
MNKYIIQKEAGRFVVVNKVTFQVVSSWRSLMDARNTARLLNRKAA